jgi:hypothetical protein
MPLPTFIIGGERRCGTTSLYRWIQQHPEVYLYPKEDMDYFVESEIAGTREWRNGEVDGEQWERTHSAEDYARLFEGGIGFRAIGQKDADLLFWRPTHSRLARYLPDGRFIFILRNPVQRAWSHYWNEVAKGRESLSFDEALAAEKERSRSNAYARNHLSYLARGFYEESLESFFGHIEPARVLIITLEQSRSLPGETLAEIYRFLGVDPKLGLEQVGTRHNENWAVVPRPWTRSRFAQPLDGAYMRLSEGLITRLVTTGPTRRRVRKYAQVAFRRPATGIPMPERLRLRLAETYAPHIHNLERLLQKKFPEWTS